MGRPERAKPLPGLLGGDTGKGLRGTQAKARGPSSVPLAGVKGVSPFADAFDIQAARGAPTVSGITGATPPCPADRLFGAIERGGLPCLSSNNSITDPAQTPPRMVLDLTPQQKKSACALAWNVQAMAEKWGLSNLGFLTLTFAEHVLDPKEAQKRLNSLSSNVLRQRYPNGYLRVLERQKSGRIHYHLLVVLGADIRSNVDFEAFGRKDYRSASPELRAEWAFWRRTAKAYGFGRTELMPVRSTEEGIGRYVGKYISKHHASRKIEDKGIRLVEYSKGARMARTRFGWCSDNAAQWRAKVRTFAQIISQRSDVRINEISDLSKHLGPRWAFHHREFIYSLPGHSLGVGFTLLTDGAVLDTNTGEIISQ